jgi:hypothetical protein
MQAAQAYRSLRGLQIALAWLLGAVGVVAILLGAAIVHRVDLLGDAGNGRSISTRSANHADDLVGTAAGWLILLTVAIFVVLIVFLYRASKNTAIWDQSTPRWSPGWTIGGWFIPIANLVIPALVVRDIWARTPRYLSDGSRGNESDASWVWTWWAAWIAVPILFRIAAAVQDGASTVSALQSSDYVRIAGVVVFVFAALFLNHVTRSLNEAQEMLGR